MDKKGPTPAAEPTVKKDKNANPLLHNGVTNKDVSMLSSYSSRSSAPSCSTSRQMARYLLKELAIS